jgi:hypothetical protein
VSLVGARDLITLRGVQRLQEADVIFYDRLVDPAPLELARRDAERAYVGKAPGAAAWPQDRINGVIVAAARAGKRVVRLKCGDPGIFARGAEEGAAACEAARREQTSASCHVAQWGASCLQPSKRTRKFGQGSERRKGLREALAEERELGSSILCGISY